MLVVFATLEVAHFTSEVPTWYLTADELLREKLGVSICETGSSLPHVRGLAGARFRSYSGLYPFLTSLADAHDDT